MKALIWFLCFFVGAALQAAFLAAVGASSAGALVAMAFFLVEAYVARQLCASWDKRKARKKREKMQKEHNSAAIEEKPADSTAEKLSGHCF